MTSKEDDTLPLPVLSQELSADVTVDEDFIPTSQPQGSGCSKLSKPSEDSSTFAEGVSYSGGIIDDTLPCESIINDTKFDKDKSADFIPDTETKKIKITYPKDELPCKKKLPVYTADDGLCKSQSGYLWENPKPQTFERSFCDLDNSAAEGQLRGQTFITHEKAVTEIIVNDSAETVDLESSPLKDVRSEAAKESSLSCSVDSDVGRCEETQIFDNSSVLLLDPPGSSIILDQCEKSIKEEISQNVYFVKTIEDSDSDLPKQVNQVVSECFPSGAADGSRISPSAKDEVTEPIQPKESASLKEEAQTKRTVEGEPDNRVATKQLDFKVTVSCVITFDTKTNKVLRKSISKVSESSKVQTKPVDLDRLSDLASDKSKRYSTSSSGSVYSDKLGLPFPLSKRISTVSDQTDSSEDDFGHLIKQRTKILERVPWRNEYLLPLKLDELVQISFENQNFSKWSEATPTSKKSKGKRNTEVSSPEKISRSSSLVSKSSLRCSEENSEKDTPEFALLESGEKVGDIREVSERQKNERQESDVDAIVERASDPKENMPQKPWKPQAEDFEPEERTQKQEETSVELCEGLSVFARWTDKRYYSGVLCGIQKSDRWDVKFDDGTSKIVREDFIMPSEWLKLGALVFALVDEKYESGQIINMEKGRKEIIYSVELDEGKKKVSSKLSELCLTDVMASIVREKYKPLNETPRGKTDIDFDNVLSGKRLREQRTPLRPPTVNQTRSSGPKKKLLSKTNNNERKGLKTVKETPESKSSGKRTAVLKSSNGHLVEDKAASADSPSGNEVSATPLRTSTGPCRPKPKPRALSYGHEDAPAPAPGCITPQQMSSDGSPVAGPSGLRARKRRDRKDEDETDVSDDADEPPAKKSVVKGKRKRKMDDSAEVKVYKKSTKKEIRNKTKSKNR